MKELDKTDWRILYHLDRNSRMPLSTLSRKVGISKEALHYRIKRLREKGRISKFYTIINTAKFGYYFFKIYLQLQNMTQKTEKEMMDYLHAHPRYGWSCMSSGRWDMIVGAWAEDVVDLEESFLGDFLSMFSSYILAKDVSTTEHNIQQNRKWLYKTDEEPISSDVGGKAEKLELDETDREILKIIANNARMSFTKIAELTKTSLTIVRHRIKRMEQQKVILSYRISFDLDRYGYEFCKSFVYLKGMNQKRINEFLEYCKYHSDILNMVTIYGSWDVELEFEVPNFESFHSHMKEIREKFGDIVKSYDSILIAREDKVDFMPGCYPPME
ncbi:MAG: Lrp/AsnC family transcriptional regulator [Candidatus Micrarchaeota archaeon]